MSQMSQGLLTCIVALSCKHYSTLKPFYSIDFLWPMSNEFTSRWGVPLASEQLALNEMVSRVEWMSRPVVIFTEPHLEIDWYFNVFS